MKQIILNNISINININIRKKSVTLEESKLNESSHDNSDQQIDETTAEADKILNEKKNVGRAGIILLSLIERCPAASRSAEVYWRLARSAYVEAKESKGIDVSAHNAVILKGFEYAEKGVELDGQSANTHKWLAIMAGEVSLFSATPVRIKNGHLVKAHTLKALEITPDDPDLLHMMGRFFFEVAGISWIQRKGAAAVFGALPEGTYQQALEYFQRAHQYKRAAWVLNDYWRAAALVKLGKKREAKEILSSVVSSNQTLTVDEAKWRAAAEQLLGTI